MARFAITYEEFLARATRKYGEAEARKICPKYARNLARTYREQAADEPPEDAAALRRLADNIDPDLRGKPRASDGEEEQP